MTIGAQEPDRGEPGRGGPGDRHPVVSCIYPPAVFLHAGRGGRVLDVTVEGFDYGIRMEPYHVTHNAFEHITLAAQKKAAVRLVDSTTSIRDMASAGGVRAVEIVGAGSHATILDSHLEGGASSGPAMDLQKEHLFARDVAVSGYGTAIRKQGETVARGPRVEEYISGPIVAFSPGQQKRSLRLPIEDVPEVPWEHDLSAWANVDDYGAKGDGKTDDSTAVQAAMSSGKSTVYFPKAHYVVRRPISIPATVRRINHLFGRITY